MDNLRRIQDLISASSGETVLMELDVTPIWWCRGDMVHKGLAGSAVMDECGKVTFDRDTLIAMVEIPRGIACDELRHIYNRLHVAIAYAVCDLEPYTFIDMK